MSIKLNDHSNQERQGWAGGAQVRHCLHGEGAETAGPVHGKSRSQFQERKRGVSGDGSPAHLSAQADGTRNEQW
jgi:hypothetical protein